MLIISFRAGPCKVLSTELIAAYLVKELCVDPLNALQTLRVRPGCVTWSRTRTPKPNGQLSPAPLEVFEKLSGVKFSGNERKANERRGPIRILPNPMLKSSS